MNCEEICWMSAIDLAAAIREKRVSPVDVMAGLLSRIERLNPALNAYCTIMADEAREAARQAEQVSMRRGETLGPLHGVPISFKDNLWVRGSRTTFGSKLLESNITAEDCPAAARLRKAGAIIVGRTNTPEFGWKGVTDNRLFGITRNPWNLDLTPGGSSGGAAAAVATGLGPIGIGTDGGGSLRIPASFCGVVGYKASHGRIPNWPVTTVDSIRHTGPITRTVSDAALVLSVLAGPDERDPGSLPTPAGDWLSESSSEIRSLKIAYSADLGYAPVDRQVAGICQQAALSLAQTGAKIEEIKLNWQDPHDCWSVFFHGGIAASLADKLTMQGDLLDPGLRKIVERGVKLSAVDYVQALVARNAFWQQVRQLFEKFDLLITPTLSVLPFAVGQDEADSSLDNEPPALQWTRFTYPFNLTGQPAISVPAGWTESGLPVGLQIVGRRFDDMNVLRVARAWERLMPWASRHPNVPEKM